MPQVTLYSLPNCPNCRQLHNWLAEHVRHFDIKDLASPEVLTEMRINGFFDLSAPVLKVAEMYYLAGWLFRDGKLQEEKLQGVLKA
jgi:glutaredoxin 3